MKQVSTADDSFPSPTPNAERRRGRRPKGKPAPQSSTQSPAEEASSNNLIFQPNLIYTSLLTFHYSLKHFRQPPTPFMKVSCGRFFSYTILLLRGLAASMNSFEIRLPLSHPSSKSLLRAIYGAQCDCGNRFAKLL